MLEAPGLGFRAFRAKSKHSTSKNHSHGSRREEIHNAFVSHLLGLQLLPKTRIGACKCNLDINLDCVHNR
jgi:hypothetical protein